MADLSITPADVTAGASAFIERGVAGEDIDAGETIYVSATTGAQRTAKLAKNNGTAEESVARGIAINSAANGQSVAWVRDGLINLGGTTIQGELYVVSSNAGKIADNDDLGTGAYVSYLGMAIDGVGTFDVSIHACSITLAGPS